MNLYVFNTKRISFEERGRRLPSDIFFTSVSFFVTFHETTLGLLLEDVNEIVDSDRMLDSLTINDSNTLCLR